MVDPTEMGSLTSKQGNSAGKMYFRMMENDKRGYEPPSMEMCVINRLINYMAG